jgi:dihydrofolate reductase
MKDALRKVILNMTMTLDGFIAGPNNELDWMVSAADPEMNKDIVAVFEGADAGFLGYPTYFGMVQYWASVAKDASASEGAHEIANAVNKVHCIAISNREEKLVGDNSELLLAQDDHALVEAITKLKQWAGNGLLVSGGVRTGQKFVRLGLIDEYILLVHPVTIGSGKRLFTSKVNLDLVSAKTYNSGVMRLCYRPR